MARNKMLQKKGKQNGVQRIERTERNGEGEGKSHKENSKGAGSVL